MLDIIRGSSQERGAIRAGEIAASKKRRSAGDRAAIESAEEVSRRIFIRRMLVGAGGAVATGGAILFRHEQTRPETDEEAVLRYARDFEALSNLDPEAKQLYDFFQDRRRKAIYNGRSVVPQEPIDPVNQFALAMVDPRDGIYGLGGVPGGASFNHNANPTHMLIKKFSSTPIMGGGLVAHETLHAHQWLTGYERNRPDGFILGELDAYTLQFRLFNLATEGRFDLLVGRIADQVPAGSVMFRLSHPNVQEFNKVFGEPKSADEQNLRLPAFLTAIDFKVFERRFPGNFKEQQANFIREIFRGSIRFAL